MSVLTFPALAFLALAYYFSKKKDAASNVVFGACLAASGALSVAGLRATLRDHDVPRPNWSAVGDFVSQPAVYLSGAVVVLLVTLVVIGVRVASNSKSNMSSAASPVGIAVVAIGVPILLVLGGAAVVLMIAFLR